MPRTRTRLSLFVTPIYLGGIPPMGLSINISWWTGWVTGYSQDSHRMLRPGIIFAQGDLPGVLFWTLSVPEPVTDHELNPRCCQHVKRYRRLECFTRQKLSAHNAWVWGENRWLGFRIGVLDGYIAAKARTSHTHSWIVQVVICSIGRAYCQIERLKRFDGRGREARFVCRII